MNEIPKKFQVTPADVNGFMNSLSNWGKWGNNDQVGCLNYITPEKRVSAACLVREGIAVSAAAPLPTVAAADNPDPVRHLMIATGLDKESFSSNDYFAFGHHAYAITHLDALCHIFHKEFMYNGYSREKVTSGGAELNSIDAVRSGVTTRGILLDIARLKGRPWLEPGEAIVPDDLEAAEKRAALHVDRGDFLLIRTGRFAYREKNGPWNAQERLAGLHASCLPWLHKRQVGALGCDGVSDLIPSRVEKVRMPIHLVAVVAMGLHLLDNADLEALGAACSERMRWEFFFTLSPLILLRGTGSPVNPLALF